MGGPVHAKLARRLRNEPTATERRLWAWLRTLRKTHGAHFRRQAPIGRFVADFAGHAAKLIIELDGPFHEPTADAEAALGLGARLEGPLSHLQPPIPSSRIGP